MCEWLTRAWIYAKAICLHVCVYVCVLKRGYTLAAFTAYINTYTPKIKCNDKNVRTCLICLSFDCQALSLRPALFVTCVRKHGLKSILARSQNCYMYARWWNGTWRWIRRYTYVYSVYCLHTSASQFSRRKSRKNKSAHARIHTLKTLGGSNAAACGFAWCETKAVALCA